MTVTGWTRHGQCPGPLKFKFEAFKLETDSLSQFICKFTVGHGASLWYFEWSRTAAAGGRLRVAGAAPASGRRWNHASSPVIPRRPPGLGPSRCWPGLLKSRVKLLFKQVLDSTRKCHIKFPAASPSPSGTRPRHVTDSDMTLSLGVMSVPLRLTGTCHSVSLTEGQTRDSESLAGRQPAAQAENPAPLRLPDSDDLDHPSPGVIRSPVIRSPLMSPRRPTQRRAPLRLSQPDSEAPGLTSRTLSRVTGTD